MKNVAKQLGRTTRPTRKIFEVVRAIFRRDDFRTCTYCPIVSYLESGQPIPYESRSDNQTTERQLESAITLSCSAVLLPSKEVPRRIGECLGGKKTKTSSGSKYSSPNANSNEEEERVMPTQTLPANNYIYIKWDFANLGWRHPSRIQYWVEAEYPIDTWVTDDLGFQQFMSGQQQFTYYGDLQHSTDNRQEIKVSHIGTWYLIIRNLDIKDIAIHYETSQI